jgi:hypothetical protein
MKEMILQEVVEESCPEIRSGLLLTGGKAEESEGGFGCL